MGSLSFRSFSVLSISLSAVVTSDISFRDFLPFCDQEKRGRSKRRSVYVCTLRVLHTRARCVPIIVLKVMTLFTTLFPMVFLFVCLHSIATM